jgi:type II secretory pathway pseudopilin PulG
MTFSPALCSPPDRFTADGGSRSAFTLIEALVAVVILSTGIVLVLGAMNTALVAADRSRDVALSTFLARQALDSASVGLREGSGSGGGEKVAVPSPWAGPGWSVETTIEDAPQASTTGMESGRLVRVRISIGKTGSEETFVHSTYAVEW